jgi:hypothetical protein
VAIPDEIPQGSKEFITVDLDSPDDLTTATVKFGFTTDPVAQPVTWVDGNWPDDGINTARTTSVWDTTGLDKAHWAVWTWVQDTPESLPRRYGVVRVV